MRENGKVFEYFRLITPIMIFALGVYISYVQGDIRRLEATMQQIDSKLFTHLTNDELHTPKSVAVSKAEFQVYRELITEQYTILRSDLCDVKALLSRRK